MDELNSAEARKLNPVERMKNLRTAILRADASVSVHMARRQIALSNLRGMAFAILGSYILYQYCAPRG